MLVLQLTEYPSEKAVGEAQQESCPRPLCQQHSLRQERIVAIPKSVHAERIQQNFNVNDFVLSPADMVQIGSNITSVPDSQPGGRKFTVVSALHIL